ncbi:IclR family transcriptional regulator [Actinosynnema sp. ALI-1.44]|uniref:IclR family transcriptional regulator n=1 Tax=Actinosynnema sp. ALI-1.44 TaxID=1933779 RepID=UPI00097CABB4|nr:IclR family transcriptional regulator [Actinosynnema sp. ALI-1.44]ONI89587.1 IclR family transcriptional regulator [Actinosynnema sp. ALI-1.44]
MYAEEADKPAGSVRSMNSVLNTLRVFEEVAMRQPIGVSELARVTGIPKGTVQRCLVTLQQAGWLKVVDLDRARWGVTSKVLALGLRGAGERDLREVAGPVIKRLAAETDETVLLGARDGECLVILAREDTSQVIRVVMDVGSRVPLRATSAGVAIMALLDSAEVDGLLERELSEFANSRVPDAAELQREIGQTSKRGYALNGSSSWYRPHVASIAAAITNADGRPVAAVTLAVPEMRYDRAREETLAPLVVAAAAEVSHLMSAD